MHQEFNSSSTWILKHHPSLLNCLPPTLSLLSPQGGPLKSRQSATIKWNYTIKQNHLALVATGEWVSSLTAKVDFSLVSEAGTGKGVSKGRGQSWAHAQDCLGLDEAWRVPLPHFMTNRIQLNWMSVRATGALYSQAILPHLISSEVTRKAMS